MEQRERLGHLGLPERLGQLGQPDHLERLVQRERPEQRERLGQLDQLHRVGLRPIKGTLPVLISLAQQQELFNTPVVLSRDSTLRIISGMFQLLKKRTRT